MQQQPRECKWYSTSSTLPFIARITKEKISLNLKLWNQLNELTEQYAFIEKFTIYTADMCCCSFARSYGENEAEAEFNTRYGRK